MMAPSTTVTGTSEQLLSLCFNAEKLKNQERKIRTASLLSSKEYVVFNYLELPNQQISSLCISFQYLSTYHSSNGTDRLFSSLIVTPVNLDSFNLTTLIIDVVVSSPLCYEQITNLLVLWLIGVSPTTK